MRIGIALGGGGARALAHIGVLRALEEAGIKLDFIAGTSMGAVVGALYALHPDINYVEKILNDTMQEYSRTITSLKTYGEYSSVEAKKEFIERSFQFIKKVYLWNLRIVKPYLIPPRPFFRIFWHMFGKKTFSDCRIPFVAVATDIKDGEVFVIEKGSIFKGVVASSALPGVFPPVRFEERVLVDGGVLMSLPAPVLRSKVDFVIGVSVEYKPPSTGNFKNVVDVLFAVDRVRYKNILERNTETADFLFRPSVHSRVWNNFDNISAVVDAGYKEASGKIDMLRRLLNRRRWKYFFRMR